MRHGIATLFWDSPLTIRYGTAENLYGHEEIAGYRAARNPASLARMVGKTVVTTYGSDCATTNIELMRSGRWGRQSQALCGCPRAGALSPRT